MNKLNLDIKKLLNFYKSTSKDQNIHLRNEIEKDLVLGQIIRGIELDNSNNQETTLEDFIDTNLDSFWKELIDNNNKEDKNFFLKKLNIWVHNQFNDRNPIIFLKLFIKVVLTLWIILSFPYHKQTNNGINPSAILDYPSNPGLKKIPDCSVNLNIFPNSILLNSFEGHSPSIAASRKTDKTTQIQYSEFPFYGRKSIKIDKLEINNYKNKELGVGPKTREKIYSILLPKVIPYPLLEISLNKTNNQSDAIIDLINQKLLPLTEYNKVLLEDPLRTNKKIKRLLMANLHLAKPSEV